MYISNIQNRKNVWKYLYTNYVSGKSEVDNALAPYANLQQYKNSREIKMHPNKNRSEGQPNEQGIPSYLLLDYINLVTFLATDLF